MKKLATIALTALIAFAMVGCGGSSSSQSTTQAEEQKAPLSLDGTWKQTNSSSEDSYQEAVIEGDTITINWVGPDTKALYWAGSYEAPTTSDDSYSWTSTNDTSQTQTALMASSDETKEFTYENGVLSYEVSALGVTTTVKLELE